MGQKEIKRRAITDRDRDPGVERRPVSASIAPADGREIRNEVPSQPGKSRAMGQDLTTANKIMIAAAQIDEERETFTAEDLIVVAWKQFPESFGLSGYRELYPDSNRVLSKLMGSVGLCSRGWLEQVSTKTYKMTPAGRKLVAVLRTTIASSESGEATDSRASRPPRRPEKPRSDAPAARSSEREVVAPIAESAPIRRETPTPIARPERPIAPEPRLPREREREEAPRVAAPVALAPTPRPRQPEPTPAPRAPIAPPSPPAPAAQPIASSAPARPAGATQFDGLPVLQRLATSVASQKFSRGGAVTFADACAFWAVNSGLNPAYLAPRLSEIEALLKRAEAKIQSSGASIRVHDRLELTLTTVIGLQGLHRMLMQKYHRELENLRGKAAAQTEDES